MADRRTEPRGIPLFWLILALALAILVLGDLNRRMLDARRLTQDSYGLQTEVAGLETEEVQLETQVAGAAGEATVVAWAHEEGKMVRQDERLVIPLPGAGATPAPTPTFASVQQHFSNWEIWYGLLFGERP